MGSTTKISWAQATWNPWIGCHKVSEGCKFCYAESLWERWGHDFSRVTRVKDATFYAPQHWREPKKIFVCSMSDFFHPAADIWREETWDIIRKTPQHLYLILTKRIERAAACLPDDWGVGWPNVWLGVTIENQKRANERLPQFVRIPAKVRFISMEPLLEPIKLWKAFPCGYYCDELIGHVDHPFLSLTDTGIHWVIIGGESGPHCRPMELSWARELIEAAHQVGAKAFFKQIGGHPNKRDDPTEWPKDLQIQEFPE